MTATDEPHAHEIVIVRRHAAHEHEHHGGAWKVAFADFMTAMMAFFLVMWLISASDKNREAIARYFNPLKLVDTTARPKGLHDAKKEDGSIPKYNADSEKKNGKEEGNKSDKETDAKSSKEVDGKPSKETKPEPGEGAEAKPTKEADVKAGKDPGGKPIVEDTPAVRSEIRLFQDPYGALAEIARGAGRKSPKRGGNHAGEGAKGGDTFRDPFAPPPPPTVQGEPDPDADAFAAAVRSVPTATAEELPSAATLPTAVERSTTAARPTDTTEAGAAMPEELALPPVPATSAVQKGDAAAVKVLKSKLEEAVGKPGPQAPGLEVRRTDEGLLISLTDKADFSMFARSSAEPDRKLVLLMESVGRVLQKQPGRIVIRGHTDARPFRVGAYDNWRLSADRAQMAHYMLVRGGFDERRIMRVEGYADRELKTPSDPLGAQNRRIEILLRSKAT